MIKNTEALKIRLKERFTYLWSSLEDTLSEDDCLLKIPLVEKLGILQAKILDDLHEVIDCQALSESSSNYLSIGDVILVGNKPPSKGKGSLNMIGRFYPDDDRRKPESPPTRGVVVLPTRGTNVEGSVHEYWYVIVTEIRNNVLIGTWLRRWNGSYDKQDVSFLPEGYQHDDVEDAIKQAHYAWTYLKA